MVNNPNSNPLSHSLFLEFSLVADKNPYFVYNLYEEINPKYNQRFPEAPLLTLTLTVDRTSSVISPTTRYQDWVSYNSHCYDR